MGVESHRKKRCQRQKEKNSTKKPAKKKRKARQKKKKNVLPFFISLSLTSFLSSDEMKPCIIAMFNFKGGVGKTTGTFTLGKELAARGHKVLMIDADPQCNLTQMA